MNPGIFAGSGSGSGSFSAPQVTGFIRDTDVATTSGGVGTMATAARAKSYNTVPSAGVQKELLAVSGRGCVNWLGLSVGTGTGLSFELEVDGAIVNSATGLAPASGEGVVVVGAGYYNSSTLGATAVFQPVYFQSSLRIRCTVTSAVTVFTLINAEIYR